jgi:sec-independent protein translocase protein TatA
MNGIESNLLAFLGWPEIVGILLVLLLLFGAKKLPELARGLGKGINEFKRASRDVQDELQRAVEEEPPPPPRPVTPPPASAPASSTAPPGSSPPA